MNIVSMRLAAVVRKAGCIVGLSTVLALCSAAHASIAQSPLLLGGGSVPGNLVLTPSVEFPTVISVANLHAYELNKKYAGYFDSDKCYDYVRQDIVHSTFGAVTGDQGGGYFTPVNFDFKTSNPRSCNGKWSGHYLNWAATPTIDPFRKALTGGYRVVDTTNQTIIEKATRAGQGASSLTISAALAAKVSPYSSDGITSSVSSGDNAYQKNKTLQIKNGSDTPAYFSVRVEVCKSETLKEDNCKQYGNSYKPEGLLQEYADDIRYSVFSYLNINGIGIDGGVLRAPQGYIGAKKREPTVAGTSNNLFKEWDPTTGILDPNPRKDAIGNSGVINYINKFGEITNQHKSNDPVSELYYAALRYLRGMKNLGDYTTKADTNNKKDFFPVITDWKDPIQYACQKNAILGIGDVNTHEDRNLLPSDDSSFMNLEAYTKKVFDFEGINKSADKETVFTGRGNSAYIAGLAYFANTQDIRPETTENGAQVWPGKQTVSTYWVDVRENQDLLGRKNNQYWLAAKYGGFKVPDNYKFGDKLEDSWWSKPGDILSTNDQRPSNFYVASDAEAMVESLRQAFAQIASEAQGTTTSLAANSSRLETGSAVFQSSVNNKLWSGDLVAVPISADNAVTQPYWSAAAKLDALTDTNSRNILSIKPSTLISASANVSASLVGIDFKWLSLSVTQQAQLQNENVLNYLRGNRTNERIQSRPDGIFRERGSRLGDIVNSDPQFVHKQDYGYAGLTSWTGEVADKYTAFRSTEAYKARIPMVIVGANDGMLHGFDARLDENGGTELFAFVPNAVYANLSQLADVNYTHRYYVDGTPRVADAWLGDKWATVAVGVGGAGSKSVFALNVTDVSGSSSVKKENVMWEFSDPRMGYNMGQPSIVALPNQKFGVIVSSGYHDELPDKGYVWILDIKDGSILQEFELATQGNLGSVLTSDLNGNRQIDRLYVADTLGQVWRIDLSSDVWGVPSSLKSGPLFKVKNSAGYPQAITAPLASAFNQRGEHMLIFGTGSFYRNGDNEIADNPSAESIYGLFDTGVLIDGRASLLKQNIIAEEFKSGKQLRAITDNKLGDEKGWYLDLAWSAEDGGAGAKGERVLAKASLRSNRAVLTSMTPVKDPCASGGTSMTMVFDLSSGMRLPYAYFDIDGDGDFGDGDYKTPPEVNKPGVVWSGVSDPSEGVLKGVNALYRWICYAGSGGAVKCVAVAGSVREGRQSWREVRNTNE